MSLHTLVADHDGALSRISWIAAGSDAIQVRLQMQAGITWQTGETRDPVQTRNPLTRKGLASSLLHARLALVSFAQMQ